MNKQISRWCRRNHRSSRCAVVLSVWLLNVAIAGHAQPPDPPVEWTQFVEVPQPIAALARAQGLPPLDVEQLRAQLIKAHCNNKYEMLLQQIYAPDAAEKQGAFRDLGAMTSPPVAGWGKPAGILGLCRAVLVCLADG